MPNLFHLARIFKVRNKTPTLLLNVTKDKKKSIHIPQSLIFVNGKYGEVTCHVICFAFDICCLPFSTSVLTSR